MSNGQHHTQAQPQPEPPRYPAMGPETPVAYYTPIAITPSTIKWFIAATVGIMGFLASAPIAERYLMPAKDSDLQNYVRIVEAMRDEQSKSRDSIARLTVAVDNLSGIVNQMRVAAGPVTRARR